MPKVNSTAIERIRPLPRPGGFRIRFHSGAEYDYDAPREVYRRLRHARSVGFTYVSEVRGRYPSRKVS